MTSHTTAQFRETLRRLPVHTVRIGLHHRALGRIEGDTIIWFWVGSHTEYDDPVSGM